jgi:hypothetical protein
MTRDEALARIDSIEADPSFQPGNSSADDARKLLGMLPEQALARMSPGWIRPQHDDSSTIEFFWSRSGLLLSPGNRTTNIRTRGDGEFGVEPRTSSAEGFDATKWQRTADGEPIVGALSLADEDAQNLLTELCKWQIGAKW